MPNRPPVRWQGAVALAVGMALGLLVCAVRVNAQSPKVLIPSAVALGIAGGTIDHDPGGYRDSFKFQPDKQAHLLASVVLAKALGDRVGKPWAFTTCLLAGLAWEAGQSRHHGFASKYDAAYDAGGCLTGALWGRR